MYNINTGLKIHNSNNNNKNNGDKNSNITRVIFFCFNSLLCIRQILRFQKATSEKNLNLLCQFDCIFKTFESGFKGIDISTEEKKKRHIMDGLRASKITANFHFCVNYPLKDI